MKGLEKVYLQRLEHNPILQQSKSNKKKKKKPDEVKREFMDRFIDDPQFITRGEKLKL